jgi:hypothetical protein
MAQRSCIFCDNPATTLEHVWPRWILTLLPERRPTRQKLMDGPKVTFKGDFKIKCACATCNNGWMSELEHESQFVVKLLVQGISIILEPKYQELLSRWVIKTAMVMEGVKPQDVPRFLIREHESSSWRAVRYRPTARSGSDELWSRGCSQMEQILVTGITRQGRQGQPLSQLWS